jgi:hypothetical protein
MRLPVILVQTAQMSKKTGFAGLAAPYVGCAAAGAPSV